MSDDAGVQRLVLGDVEVVRVREWTGGFPADEVFPDIAREDWAADEDRLAPEHWEPATHRARVAVQTWVLHSGGRTILVDTGVGDGRDRPDSPHFHHWQGGLLGLLARAGVEPADVDVVVNTHLHVDHVGWNTLDAGGEWVPTFPRARYLLPAADDAFFGPANGYARGRQQEDRLLYEECVRPIHRAGQAVLWEDSHAVDEHLTLEAAPGHTPGSSVLRLDSGGERAVFVGDLLHSPVQVLHPSCSSAFCQDPRQAAQTRHRILARAVDERELLVPAHFAGTGAVQVREAEGGFALGAWSPLG